jgi:hypothetical protein
MRLAVPHYLRLGTISAQIRTPGEARQFGEVRRRFRRAIKVATGSAGGEGGTRRKTGDFSSVANNFGEPSRTQCGV